MQLCLLCGDVVCAANLCCRQGDLGECSVHAVRPRPQCLHNLGQKLCGAGTSFYILLRSSMLVAVVTGGFGAILKTLCASLVWCPLSH